MQRRRTVERGMPWREGIPPCSRLTGCTRRLAPGLSRRCLYSGRQAPPRIGGSSVNSSWGGRGIQLLVQIDTVVTRRIPVRVGGGRGVFHGVMKRTIRAWLLAPARCACISSRSRFRLRRLFEVIDSAFAGRSGRVAPCGDGSPDVGNVGERREIKAKAGTAREFDASDGRELPR